MKSIFVIFIFFLTTTLFAQLPNDCDNTIVTCGDSTVSLNVNGIGTQELGAGVNCSSQENNSIWLKIIMETSGTLGFTLTPGSTDINEDYDFFVFGPNVTCGNIGRAIRCSTTNPQGAGQSNNLTGMNGNETDTSEGPGQNGNSFVQWLNVTAGDSYFIVIDRPIGNSPFSLVWTGTATFAQPPSNQMPNGTSLDLEECETNNNNLATFNLRQNEAQMVNLQNVTVSYHKNISDAQIGINPIVNTNSYDATNSTTIQIRLTDNTSDCFSIFDMNLTVHALEINTPNKLYQCDTSGFSTFNFTEQTNVLIGNNSNANITYYTSQNNATMQNGAIGNSYNNTLLTETIWYRLDNTINGCFYIDSFEVEVLLDFFNNPEPMYVNQETVIYCEETFPDTIDLAITFDNNPIIDYQFLWSTGANTNSIAVNMAGDYSVTITNPQGCEIEKTFHVNGSRVFTNPEPNFIDETIYYCTDTYPTEISLSAGFENHIFSDFTSINWSNLETTENILINETGNYTVEIYNADNCFVSRTITVLPSNKPVIETVSMSDTLFPNRVSILIETSGDGDYVYGIDLDPSELNDDTNFQNENYFDNLLYGEHIIYVKDRNGCGITQKEILLLSYPKFVTPNGDGQFDTWNIDNLNAVAVKYNTISKVRIFDRYGKVVAIIDSNSTGWNGKYNGKKVIPSDYWFTVDLTDYKGKTITKKGYFSLIY